MYHHVAAKGCSTCRYIPRSHANTIRRNTANMCLQVITVHMQCAPHLWGTSSSSPWRLLQLMVAVKPLGQWPAPVRLQLLQVLVLSQTLPVACSENGTLSSSWSAAFLTPVLQHMLECTTSYEDRAVCEEIVYNCLCHLQLHQGPDTVVRNSLLHA